MTLPKILVTGGAGFIGSHACVALIAAGYQPVVLDTLVNSDPRSLLRVARITGVEPVLVRGDVRDAVALDRAFAEHGVRRGAAPGGAQGGGPFGERSDRLLRRQRGGQPRAGARHGARGGAHADLLVVGHGLRRPAALADPGERAVCGRQSLRADQGDGRAHARGPRPGRQALGHRVPALLQPHRAHESGLLGEHPHGPPDNLLPYVSQVAVGERTHVTVHGDDYETPDGTGVRDYVHVMDVAEGHVAALRHATSHRGLLTVNLGTGRGASVLEVISAFERACGRAIRRAHRTAPHRRCPGLLGRRAACPRPARLARPQEPGPDVRGLLALAAREPARLRRTRARARAAPPAPPAPAITAE
jgi:UDP-glucose 4-epimerase